MKTLSLVCVVWGMIALSTAATAVEPPDSLWSQPYGGSSFDQCYCVQQTTEGGYVLAGMTGSFDVPIVDFWLIKTDADGNTVWNQTYGGKYHDECHYVRQTLDGGYILGGFTYSFGYGMQDFWVVRTDKEGDSLWSRSFGGEGWDVCKSIQETPDGGFILGGYTSSFGAGSYDAWLIRMAKNGDSLWSRTFGGSGYDECHALEQTDDGGYILAGVTFSFGAGASDFWLVKTDRNGDSLWSRTYGGVSWDECHSVQGTSDGGYILAGYSHTFGPGQADFWVVKTDADGDSLWSAAFGGPWDDMCNCIQQTSDGGYILGGSTTSFSAGYEDFWLVKLDACGNMLWNRSFGGELPDIGQHVQQTSGGSYVLAGWTESFGMGQPKVPDFWLVKTGPERPYDLTMRVDEAGTSPVLHWMAPSESDYRVYSTTNPNHDGNPPGPDWTLEATLTNQAAGPASWFDTDAFNESYRNYMVVMSCP